jgi:hypothetical protein
LTFNELGDYMFELLFGDRVIGARKFTVINHRT